MTEAVEQIEEVFNKYTNYDDIRGQLDPVIGKLVGRPRTEDVTWLLLYGIIFEDGPGVRSVTINDLGIRAKKFDEILEMFKERGLDEKIKHWYFS